MRSARCIDATARRDESRLAVNHCRSAEDVARRKDMYRVARGGAAMAVAMMALASASARAQQGATPAPSPSSALDPGSPLAPLPDIGVDCPDLATAPGAEQAAQGERAEIAADIDYSYTVKGLEDARNDLLRQRFDDLSTLKAHE